MTPTEAHKSLILATSNSRLARSIVRLHSPGEDGRCDGCTWEDVRLAPWPCPTVRTVASWCRPRQPLEVPVTGW